MGFFRSSEPAPDRRMEYLTAEQIREADGLLTPEQVRNVAFGKPPIGQRGYNEDEVDDFLDRAEATIRELGERLSKYEEL